MSRAASPSACPHRRPVTMDGRAAGSVEWVGEGFRAASGHGLDLGTFATEAGAAAAVRSHAAARRSAH